MAKRQRSERPPKWIDQVVEAVRDTMSPLDGSHIAAVGVRVEGPTKEGGWVVFVFPQCNEMLGGRHDGRIMPPAMSLCVTGLLQRVFDLHDVHIDWNVPNEFSGDFDGPHLVLDGRYKANNALLTVTVFDEPPHDEPLGAKVNTYTGQIQAIGRPADDQSA